MSHWIIDPGVEETFIVDLHGGQPPVRLHGTQDAVVLNIVALVGPGPVSIEFFGIGYSMAMALWHMGVTVRRLGYGPAVAP